MNNELNQLQQEWSAAKAAHPKMRIRDLAALLHTSEAQLIALGSQNLRLAGDFRELLKEVHTLGPVMALTRNDHAVHERHGVYNNTSFDGQVGLVLDADIDLRLFMMHWAFGFAVTEGERRSLQFFDKSGAAVHKIYITEASNVAAYEALARDRIAQAGDILQAALGVPEANLVGDSLTDVGM